MYVWYPFQMPSEACLKQGFHVIAMLKTNRTIEERPQRRRVHL
ncbi:hypothetical protein B4113_0116 [Geobacillus sp. B4113_201601]|nr:hypothetical protein B4113_0116 [Geobacillus sp. B4113_201601]